MEGGEGGGVREKDEGEGGERWRVRRWGWEMEGEEVGG